MSIIGMNLRKRVLVIFITTIFILQYIFVPALASDVSPGLGEIYYEEKVTFAPNASYTKYISNHPIQGREQAYTMEFKPGDKYLKLVSSYGDKVYGGNTLTEFMNMTRAEGNVVVGGINGDFYNINTSVPIGPVIKKGRIITASDAGYTSVGFTADGEVVIGELRIGSYLKWASNSVKVNSLNKDISPKGCFVFTNEFANTTKSNVLNSYDIICDITGGNQAIDGSINLKVVEVKDNAKDTAIGDNRVVLSVANTAENQSDLSTLKTISVNDELTLEFVDESGEGSKWSLVQEAIGSGQPMVEDGQIVTGDTSVHPRTCFGLKADGTVVMFLVDGRQPGYSTGMSLVDIAEYMRQQGCIDAVNFDGGGSSTIAAVEPGNTLPTILNKPSDGGERSNSNALILVSNMTGDGIFANLHINPVKSIVLEGAKAKFTLKGTDSAFQPATIPAAPTWSTEGEIGEVDQNGILSAGTASASGKVVAMVNEHVAAADIQVVGDVDFKFNVTSLTLNSGQSYDINIVANWNNIPAICQDSQFVWSVEGDIGTIDAEGRFKASEASGMTGKIKAVLRAKSYSIDVNIGKLPIIVEDFEDGIVGLTATGARLPANGIKISEETNEELVRFGNKSLKLEYDMVGGQSGTAGAYVGATPYVLIDGYPTHIGMWVYGDGKGHWLRGQLRDGTNAAFAVDYTSQNIGVDWVGWKYVEAPIPTGRPLPLKVDLPVRYMQTVNEKKTAGVLYVDNIRLIYGYKNDDLTPPVIDEILPADGSTLRGYTNIRVQVKDNESGINPNRINFYVDNQPRTDFMYNADAGNVQWNTHEMVDGKHKFTLKLKDNFGNETVKDWYYTWDTGKADIYQQIPDASGVYAGGAYEYQLCVNDPTLNFNSVDLTFQYNQNNIEIVSQDLDASAEQIILGDALQGANVIENYVAAGRIRIAADNITAAQTATKVATIRFRVKPSAIGNIEIKPLTSLMNGKSFYLDGMSLPIKNKINLAVKGITAGYSSTIEVRDETGNGVEGATLIMDGIEYPETTNNNGILKTNSLTTKPIGTLVNVQTVKDGYYSNTKAIKITESLGTVNPSEVVLSISEDNRHSVGVNWQTNLSVSKGRVQFVKAEGFTDFESAQGLIEVEAKPEVLLTNYNNEWREIKTFSAIVNGFEPGAQYKYRVGGDGGVWSSVNTYNTSERVDSKSGFKFYYVSDPQSANESGFVTHYNTLGKAYQTDGSGKFTVISGDIVDSGFSRPQWEWFFKNSGEFATSIPIVPVVGNHEVMSGDEKAQNYKDSFTLPDNGPDGMKELCYSFDYGFAHFAVLNSEENLEEQLEWLKEDMKSAIGMWKIVMIHRGPYPSFYDGTDIRQKAVPVFEELGINLVLSGHDHVYSRTTMRQGQRVPMDTGTTYVTGGTSGQKFYDGTPKDYLDCVYDENKQVYSIIEVLPKTIGFNAYNADGQSVDSFNIERVLPVLDKVLIAADKTALKIGDVASISISGTMDDGSTADLSQAQITFMSDNLQVAEVDQNGKVNAVGEGIANIKATVTMYEKTIESSIRIFVDQTPPVTEIEITGNERNGWYRSDVTVALNAVDDSSGISGTVYRMKGAEEWISYSEPFIVTNEGINTVTYRSTDKAGNVEDSKEKLVRIDRTKPTFEFKIGGKGVNNGDSFEDCNILTFNVKDAHSGMDSAKISVFGIGSGKSEVYSVDLNKGLQLEIDFAGKVDSYRATITLADKAGNTLDGSCTFKVVTSIPSVRKLMERYEKAGELKDPLAMKLKISLKQAEFFANIAAKASKNPAGENIEDILGLKLEENPMLKELMDENLDKIEDKIKDIEEKAYKKAIKHMEDFIRHLNNDANRKYVSDRAKRVLVADAKALIDMWSR